METKQNDGDIFEMPSLFCAEEFFKKENAGRKGTNKRCRRPFKNRQESAVVKKGGMSNEIPILMSANGKRKTGIRALKESRRVPFLCV